MILAMNHQNYLQHSIPDPKTGLVNLYKSRYQVNLRLDSFKKFTHSKLFFQIFIKISNNYIYILNYKKLNLIKRFDTIAINYRLKKIEFTLVS